jgi:Flp pilus assembly protein TadG
MRLGFGSNAKRGLRAERGAAAVEFAIILPVLIFLILGGMDLGHMFYIEHLVTNASREGARYGAKYTGNPPSDPSAEQIKTYLISTVPPLDGLDVPAPVYTNVAATPSYRLITVTVTAHKHWWVLGSAWTVFKFAGFTNPMTLNATTTMKVEY